MVQFEQRSGSGYRFTGCGKTQFVKKKQPLGLKPTRISNDLRGPEGPLFHGSAYIRAFFRKLFYDATKGYKSERLLAVGACPSRPSG
jgi:hypothetical protein